MNLVDQARKSSARCGSNDETGAVSILLPIVCLMLCLSSRSFLADKLADTEGFPRLFNYSYGLMLFALSLAVVYWGTIATAMSEVWSRWRYRLLFLGVNLLLMSAVLVVVLTKLGGILVLAFSAGVIFCVAVSTEQKTVDRFQKLLPASIVFFVALYATGATAEGLLRLKPQFVGGGGGGNPALRRIYQGLYSVNTLGLRGPELPPAASDPAHRILVVGDSFTFGQGVKDHQTFPVYLEEVANQASPFPRYRVINAGRSGTNTREQVEFLEQRGLGVEPDSILVQFYLNDLEVNARSDSASDAWIDQLLNQPLKMSYTLFFLKDRCDRLMLQSEASACGSRPADIWMQGLLEQIRNDGDGWRAFETAVKQFASLQDKRGVPVRFVLYPHPGLDSSFMREIHECVAAKIREFDLTVVDLLDVFDELEASDQIVSEMDHHPSPAMHRIAAASVWQALAGGGDRLGGDLASYRTPDDGCNPQACKDNPCCHLPAPVTGEDQSQ